MDSKDRGMGDAKAGGFAAEKMRFPFFFEFLFVLFFLLIIDFSNFFLPLCSPHYTFFRGGSWWFEKR